MMFLFCFCFYILKEIVKDDSNEDYAAKTLCDPPSYLLTDWFFVEQVCWPLLKM